MTPWRRSSALVVALGAAALAADPDPWMPAGASGPELLMVLEKSERSYSLTPTKTAPADANGPERVALPLSSDETDALANCRALVAKGEHDAAGKVLDELLAKNAADWDAHVVRAQSLHARVKDAEAMTSLRTSLIGNRRNPDAWKLAAEVAKALGKKLVRPKLDVRGWVKESPTKKGEVVVGSVYVNETDFPWSYYADARAVFRYEGGFKQAFPAAPAYFFSFKEQMTAMVVLAREAAVEAKKATLPPELRVVVDQMNAGTLTPFTYFAVWPTALTTTPEPGLAELRPRLEKYFDEKILGKP